MPTPNIVIFTGDRNYLRHICCAMVSLLRHLDPAKNVDVGILTAEKDPEMKNVLSRHFARFNPNPENRLIFPNLDTETLEGLPVCDRLPIAAYFRLLLPAILDHQYETALYLDGDVAVLKDISPMFDLLRDDPDHDCAAVTDMSADVNAARLNMPPGSTYCNSGVMVIDLKRLRDSGRELVMLDCARREIARLTIQDQDAINLCFAGRIKILPFRYNFQVGHKPYDFIPLETYKSEKKEVWIAHYYGYHKPWKYAQRIPPWDFAGEYFRTLALTDYRSYVWRFRLLRALGFGLLLQLGGRIAPCRKWRRFCRDWKS